MANNQSMESAKIKEKSITADMLRQVLSYDPVTGNLHWKIKSGPRSSGSIAGSMMKTGYLEIGVLGYRMKAHRVCWCLHYGSWPDDMIDHINMVRSDNRIDNLREARNGQNMCNAKALSNNKSGTRGVYFCKQTGMWSAEIVVDGRKVWLGRHRSKDKAIKVRSEATLKYHGDFAYNRKEG